MPRRSCSGAGKEEGKNAERRCRRKRHGPGLVDDGASRAHEAFSACRGRRAHRSRGCGYLNRNARGLARRNRATPSRRCPWSLPLGRFLAQADHFRTAAIASATPLSSRPASVLPTLRSRNRSRRARKAAQRGCHSKGSSRRPLNRLRGCCPWPIPTHQAKEPDAGTPIGRRQSSSKTRSPSLEIRFSVALPPSQAMSVF